MDADRRELTPLIRRHNVPSHHVKNEVPPQYVNADRRELLPSLTEDLPWCVLFDVAASLDIKVNSDLLENANYRSKLVRTISGIPPKIYPFPIRRDDYHRIITYINPDAGLLWTAKLLNLALELMSEYSKITIPRGSDMITMSVSNLTPASVSHNHGLINKSNRKTQKISLNINVCIWYKWCMQLGGSPDCAMTGREIKNYCILLQESRECLLRRFNLEIARSDDRMLARFLATFISKENSFTKDMALTQDNLLIVHNIFSKSSYSTLQLSRIEPKSWIELVYLSVICHRTDLSTSSNTTAMTMTDAFDDNMKAIVTSNNSAFYITNHFNPLFPMEMYTDGQLLSLASQVNIGTSFFNNEKHILYHELVTNSMIDSFHEGLQAGVSDFTSLIDLVDTRHTDSGPIICYGSRSTVMIPYTISSLADLFMHNRNYDNPKGGVFEKAAIDKLKSIAVCRSEIENRVPLQEDDARMKWRNLHTGLERVEMYHNASETMRVGLLETYEAASPPLKLKIQTTLEELERMAMYMRGWKGNISPYPIEEATNDDHGGTDIRVCESMRNFKLMCGELDCMPPTFDSGSLIMNLPLLRYMENSFSATNDPNHGLTVGERISIIERGEIDNNVQACIRISSNYLAASAYRYIVTIGKNPGFSIEKLHYIS